VASVIFTASTLHAAVNFPQNPIMSFAPAYPLGVLQPPITEEEKVERWIEYHPRIEIAQLQLFIGKLLGGIHHTV
ncbi:unnamed protein product, partial [Discosporangium mesarthrocarpum]